jgi:beta-lactam-binding protein with PASTA domain
MKCRLYLIIVVFILASSTVGCGPTPPSVKGMELMSATAALESAGFRVSDVTYDETVSEATGTVIGQRPVAGQRAENGSLVALTVAGFPPVATPNLAGLDEGEVSDALAAAKLSLGQLTKSHSASVAAGCVVSQVPVAGELVAQGSPVVLVISTGPESVRIPIVKGRTESRAKERLKAAGFKVKIVRAGSSEEPGTVIAQKPSRGKASPGSTITITVSTSGASGQASGDSASGGSDEAAARAFEQHKSGIQLKGEGTVTKVLADDSDGGRHQRFILRLASGQTLLIAHNVDIAPRVPSLQSGDSVAFSGIYEWNSEGGVVHWTHRDPDGQHPAGWLKHDGSTYQ